MGRPKQMSVETRCCSSAQEKQRSSGRAAGLVWCESQENPWLANVEVKEVEVEVEVEGWMCDFDKRARGLYGKVAVRYDVYRCIE
jgi:hypothetical protein